MPLVECKCTNCGAVLKVDKDKDAAICEFCQTPFIVQKAINNYNTINNISDSVVNIYNNNLNEKENLIKRMFTFLEEGNVKDALLYSERILDLDPECADAYLCKLLVDLRVKHLDDLEQLKAPFDKNINYKKILKYDAKLGEKVAYANISATKECTYRSALRLVNEKMPFNNPLKDLLLIKPSERNKIIENNKQAITLFSSIPEWKYSERNIEICNDYISQMEKEKRVFKRIISSIVILLTLCCIIVILFFSKIKPNMDYNSVLSEVESGNYENVNTLLSNITLTDSTKEKAYLQAKKLYQEKEYAMSYFLFDKLDGYKDSKKYRSSILDINQSYSYKYAKVGETIKLGYYEQDGNESTKDENIEWIVLEKQDNKMLVISKYALDGQVYYPEWENVCWETSTIRSWINDTFYNTAFNKEEQSYIATTLVFANVNPNHPNEDQGSQTKDKLFLLSAKEANTYFALDVNRKCIATNHAIEAEVEVNSANNCNWWLRTAGAGPRGTFVDRDGSIDYYGNGVYYDKYGVRPAMWLIIK